MTRFISALLLALGLSLGLPAAAQTAGAAEPPRLAEGAPDRYVVLPGDTLWGIAGKFLQQPWRWPEIWRLNREQVANPHRIFPGDVIALERGADGNPQLRIVGRQRLSPRIYDEPVKKEIPSIPANVIEPFTSEPLIVEPNELDSAPVIVASGVDRVMMGNGDTAYVANASDHADQEKWQIYRPGKPLLDPETRQVLGYEAFYLGTARQVQPGDPAVFEIVTMKQEIARGDRLIPASPPPLINYAPHMPEATIDARIASVYGGVTEGGRYSIISLNRGHRDGLEVGHVLALSRNRVVPVRNSNGRRDSLALPDERYGLAFVFRVFENVAYALVANARGSVVVNDFARNP